MVQFQLVLCFYMLAGIVAGKLKIMTEQGRNGLSAMLVDVLLPFTILNGFLNDVSLEAIRASFEVVLAASLVQAVFLLISKTIYRKVPLKKKCMLEYATTSSNYSFLGIPSAQAAFGNDGYYLTAISQIIYRIVLWGISTPAVVRAEHPEMKQKWYLFFKNPCMIALIVGLLTLFLPFDPPAFLLSSVKGISACSTPLCMMVVGYNLLGIDWHKTPWGLLSLYCVLRLIVLPAIAFGILQICGFSALTRNVVVLIAAMPAPSTAAIFAQKYNQDANFTSQFVSITTVLSFATVPMVVGLLQTY